MTTSGLTVPPNKTIGQTGETTDYNTTVDWIEQADTRLLPAGGTTGQIAVKNSNADYDVGWVANAGSSISPPVTLTGTNPAQVHLTVVGAASQTANIVDFRMNGAATPNLGLTDTGEVRLGPGTTNTNGTLRIGNTDATRRGINIQLAAAQSADAIRVTNSTPTALMTVAADGTVNAPNVGTPTGASFTFSPVLFISGGGGVPAGTPVNTVIVRP